MINHIDLAFEIMEAGGSVPVPSVHHFFDDAVKGEDGLPFSKTAAVLIDQMFDAGLAEYEAGYIYKISVNPETIGFFTGVGYKYASHFTGDLKAVASGYLELEEKISTEMNSVGDQSLPAQKFNPQEEFNLWKNWKKTGSNDHLSDLLDRYHPFLERHASVYYSAPLPRSAIKGEAKRLAIKAFETYDPRKGTQLNTHVGIYMKKLNRYVNSRRNIVRAPEEWNDKIGLFQRRQDELKFKHGRSPTTSELSDDLGWHEKDVGKMYKFLRKDLVQEETPGLGRMETSGEDKANNYVNFLHKEFSGNDALVFEHIYGLNGKRQLDNVDHISKETGLSASTINRSKKTIAEKAEHYMKYSGL
jgi:DNA-directed RNA polymerase specialized sigma subunit